MDRNVEIQRQTAVFLDSLGRTEFFHAVGQPLPGKVERVNSWFGAHRLSRSNAWTDAQNEVANDLRARVRAVDKTLYNTWNDHVNVIKPQIEAIIRRQMTSFWLKRLVLGRMISGVEWDLLIAATERQFSGVCPLGVGSLIGDYYLAGHYPCGWLGEYPEGQLVVF